MDFRDLNRMAEMQRALASQSEALRYAANPYLKWAKAAEEQERRLQSAMGVLYYRDHLEPIVNAYKNSVAGIAMAGVEHEKWYQILNQQAEERRRLLGIASGALPSTIWESSMSRVLGSMSDIGLLDRYPVFSDRLLQPYNYYSEFARETYERLEESVDDVENVALSASLVLADEEVSDAADFLVETIEEPSEEQQLGEEPPKLNLLELQRADLIVIGDIRADSSYDDLILLSPSARIAQMARSINQAVIDCNHIARVAGLGEIFKPTTAAMEAHNTLPWVIAQDKITFGSIVDCLYIMLYEAAGNKNLRFTPYVEDKDCTVIWTLKHLRNKWLRHDADHGSDGEIRKSRQQLKEALESLRAATMPMTGDQYRQLQQELLSQTLAFLETLKGKLTETVAADTSNQRAE